MFAPYCEAHRSVVLLPTSSITAMTRGRQGLVVEFTCDCGQVGTWTGPSQAR
ncbi:MAG: hypothetical protein WAL25_10115 [Acidimicrobiia bacterium]